MYKLNLGCGNKLMSFKDGWINVDIADPLPNIKNMVVLQKFNEEVLEDIKDTAGIVYIQTDITKLESFPSNYFLEIHAYHVIEHFFLDVVGETLEVWRDKLKEGGSIYLEQPDIIKCAINLLQLKTTKDITTFENLGILGIFGGAKTTEVHHIHKWGWTFETLKRVLQLVGFTDIKETTPLTHAREARDFRIEGKK